MKTVTIGGASAMWGDSAIATPQLLTVPSLDYLIYDYLAETTMAILARTRAGTGNGGYATDFVRPVLADHLETIVARGVRVIANAGGLDPLGCRDAIAALAAERGLTVTVAAVTGDDLLAELPRLRTEGAIGEDGSALPDAPTSANAYLGARPIVEALARGARIVVTGRVVDSALTLAPLVHAFGWAWDDYDRLAQGSLAGHVIECGAQATGGLFTDWTEVPGWDDIGYPLVECHADGTFDVAKPADTGGLIAPAAVAEQIVYEIGDPAAYLLPDVVCDWRDVRVSAAGAGRVRVTGARGRAPSGRLKLTATGRDGFRIDVMLAIRGIDAVAKAKRTADALLTRTRRQMRAAGFDDYTDVAVELLGAEAHYGPHARAHATREVVLRIAAHHRDAAALEFLRREAPSTGTSMGPGTRGHFGGRADITPVIRVASCLVAADAVAAVVDVGGQQTRVVSASPAPVSETRIVTSGPAATPDVTPDVEPTARVRLVTLAWARSGDKGDASNIGVIARRDDWYGLLRQHLTAARVAAHFAHLLDGGRVDRFELAGLHALNFVLHGALGGGGAASLRSDPLGKAFAQILLDLELDLPAAAVGAARRPGLDPEDRRRR